MRPEIFSGYCPKCDSELVKNASFCPKCGESLIDHAYRARLPEKLPPEAIQRLYQETHQLFIVWLLAFLTCIASIVLLRFHEPISIPIVAITIFVYTWVFLLAQMERLAIQVQYDLARLVYLSLLIPVIGTIYTFFRISQTRGNLG